MDHPEALEVVNTQGIGSSRSSTTAHAAEAVVHMSEDMPEASTSGRTEAYIHLMMISLMNALTMIGSEWASAGGDLTLLDTVVVIVAWSMNPLWQYDLLQYTGVHRYFRCSSWRVATHHKACRALKRLADTHALASPVCQMCLQLLCGHNAGGAASCIMSGQEGLGHHFSSATGSVLDRITLTGTSLSWQRATE